MQNQVKLNHSLSGKKVIILGGSSGLGFAAAKAADAEGAQVIIVSSNQKNIDKALLELSAESKGGVVNLRDEENIKAFFLRTRYIEHTGKDIKNSFFSIFRCVSVLCNLRRADQSNI